MRLIRESVKNSEIDSTASSLKSTDSFGVFGSACSDCSDCEYCDVQEQQNKYCNVSSSSCTNLSFYSATDERHPLLFSHNLTNTYKTNSSSSDTLGPGELSASDIIATYKKSFQKSVIIEKTKQSSLVTIFSIWNTIMGSSLLTMAWGVQRAGLPTALFLLVFMSALCLYTAYLLLRVNYHHGSETCEVPALCRVLLGAGAAAVAHAFSLMVLLGASVLYWLLITNFLYYTVIYLMDLGSPHGAVSNASVLCPSQTLGPSAPLAAPSPYWGLHTTVPFYVAIVVFPLLNFTKVSFFTKFNSLGTLSVFYLIIFIIVKCWSWGAHVGDMLDAHVGGDAAVLSGMLALSFYIHNIIITIMSNNARQEKNGRDLTIAFLLVTVTYALVGVVFYVCFPLAKSCIEDNILNNFDMHDVMTAIARAVLLFQVITVYPLVVFMLRCEAAQLSARAAARGSVLALNVAVVALCILVACVCPNIGTIIRYTGAISGLVHVFALPALLHMRSLQLRGQLTLWKGLLYFAIIVFGTANLVMQFFIA
ncbi:sodium-coupled neutral amino acid transporter 9 homolog [Bicyclus anynana]|uniref:Sodium-coupled neutral amino acid transporter 9 homolog n=1 Tax=Bicyclus anynana TaxID=110368 RepID=A0ABM3LWA8_BICAN|nr:sodium-coupled neutral amino acid transporter 9 homolog [Bicyclus anynana]